MLQLSPGEIEFIVDGIKQDIRADGRARLDYRPLCLETGIVTQANGSARVVLSGTDVMVGVKVELEEPSEEKPNQGRVEVAVECCPSASPEFEGRGGDALNLELARLLERYLNLPTTLDLKALCLVPYKQCWVIYVDALVLDSAGNLFDALSIATRAALLSTEIPVVSVVENTEEGGHFDIELGEDLQSLPILDIPVFVTLTRIGSTALVDTTLEEEYCSECRIAFAVNSKGIICTTQKGNGLVGLPQLQQMMLDASVLGMKMIDLMDRVLKTEQGKESHGFLGNDAYV
eukprot:TRINITY_DN697_c0_g1_i5.p1 TRINITY_DN697_c0_g1~~TRINITY_DN697_c0_g1_i5.p1  ORF type:complete len:289 (+),score=73.39 TRINITY_DN697_c0_g1_i5:86-952(+)